MNEFLVIMIMTDVVSESRHVSESDCVPDVHDLFQLLINEEYDYLQ